jgi:hypothetical protein
MFYIRRPVDDFNRKTSAFNAFCKIQQITNGTTAQFELWQLLIYVPVLFPPTPFVSLLSH